VRRGIKELYAKIKRHLSDGTGLLVVVWRAVNDEFMKRYKHFEALIEQCYPDSQIRFEFSSEDLLTYFAEASNEKT
jgi:hypothetical protein